MKKQNTFTKIALGIDIVALLALVIYFAITRNPPITDLRGLLILSPPLFGLLGIIAAIIGFAKSKTKLSIALIIMNIAFLCWWPIVWFGGTLLFGP
jgi:hypothetical protein